MKTLLVCLFAAALSAAAAETHRITLFQDSMVNGTPLKAGDYKVVVEDGKMTVIQGRKRVAEAKVAVESGDGKYGSTSIRYANADGKYRVSEIRVGGTNKRLVVADGGAVQSGQ